MDPEQTLIDLRAAVRDHRDATSISQEADAAERMADGFEALDGWLTKGGFLPADWAAAR